MTNKIDNSRIANKSKSAIKVSVDNKKDARLSDFGKAVLKDRYLMPDESYQDIFARVSSYYGDDQDHADRIYGYISNLWFMPATPILSNGGTNRGLPISCFLNESSDSLQGIVELWNENVWLASKGGGIGSYWGNLRSIGETVRGNGKTSGIIPFIKVMDSQTLAISQGSLRRGSAAVYLPIHHPEIEEFIDLRRPTGGDPNRRSLNLHHGVVITDEFMKAVKDGKEFSLKSSHSNQAVEKVDARSLWIKLLTARVETGEPYMLFIDSVNRSIPEHHKAQNLYVKTSNLCSEITLPTGIDHLGNDRTAVCCLSSLNLEYYEEWKDNDLIIEDIMRFLDNVLQDFIDKAPDSMSKAKYSAARERSVGLGVMGFHSFLQSKNVPIESAMSKVWNKKIFQHIKKGVDKSSKDLAKERGACLDAKEQNHDMEEVLNNSDSIIIKKNPWDRDEVIQTVKDDRDQQDEEDEYEEEEYVNDILGAVCSKDINYMTEVELDEFFGPFKPMTSEQYPILFKNIVKDSMGTILWILFIILIVLIILWFLCLFNKTGRAIFLGPEKLMKAGQMKLCFMEVHRLKRGCYEMKIVPLVDADPEKKGSATLAHVKHLEQIIQAKPESWLWSHRRWKNSQKK